MSGDPEQRYFSDGITEDIITELSRFASLEVVARNSTFVYRDQAMDIRALGKALGASFLLEGSLRKAGNRIRLTAQLINVNTGKHVWADRYDRELEDIFAIQDELVHAIVATLADRLATAETERSMRKPPENLVAYDYYLRAVALDRNYDRESGVKARELLEEAIELDPAFARAHALLAAQIWTVGFFDDLIGRSYAEDALNVARRAVQLDPDDSFCNSILATAYLQNRNYEQSRHYHELAMTLNPHDSFVWSDYAWYLMCVGEFAQALELLTRREAIEPVPPPDWHWEIRGQALYGLGRWEEAIAALERSATVHSWVHACLAACYGQLGDKAKARDDWAHFVETYPNAKPELIRETDHYKNPADADRWLEGLQKAGISE
jgi:TolB-like protein